MVEKYGVTPQLMRAQHFTLRWRERHHMVEYMVEILLVEDNPRDAELALHALNEYHITNNIVLVRDGAEALEFMFATGRYADRNMNNQPRVILLDLKLPKVDGREVLRQLKADERTRIIPVVVMTSSQEESDIVAAYKLGVNSYIVKPVDFAQFTESMRQLGMYWMLLNHPPLP
jgi:two-component system, response regulator